MYRFKRLVPAWVIGCLALALAADRVLADDGDPLASKVRTAWQKFSDLQATKMDYGERAEVALTMIQTERERADVEAAVRNLKIQIDSFPARRTNLQQEVYDQWLYCRQRLTELDLYIAQLRSRWQELNEIAIRQAEVNGKRVRPLDRVGLLNELQRLDRECFDAFVSLRSAVTEAASEKSLSPALALKNAMNNETGSSQSATQFVPQQQFVNAFRQFYGRGFVEKTKKSSRMTRKSRSNR